MATRLTTITRSVPAIVQDMATTRQRLACCDANPREGDGWDALNSRLVALEIEFDEAVFQATGVCWDMLSAVRS